MATITTRAGKGTPLTNAELDANFTNLNSDISDLKTFDSAMNTALTGFGTTLNNKVDKEAGKGLSTNDFTTAEKSKLIDIAAQATKNQTDAVLKDRANHTGTQSISTVSGLQTALDSKLDTSSNRPGTLPYGVTASAMSTGYRYVIDLTSPPANMVLTASIPSEQTFATAEIVVQGFNVDAPNSVSLTLQPGNYSMTLNANNTVGFRLTYEDGAWKDARPYSAQYNCGEADSMLAVLLPQLNGFVNKDGDTLTGPLTFQANSWNMVGTTAGFSSKASSEFSLKGDGTSSVILKAYQTNGTTTLGEVRFTSSITSFYYGSNFQKIACKGVDLRDTGYPALNFYYQNTTLSSLVCDMAGGMSFNGGGTWLFNGGVICTGNFIGYYSSDRKLKQHIRPIPNALEKVNAIGGKLFTWKSGFLKKNKVPAKSFGVIAQDVQKVFPEAVHVRDSGELAVDYVHLSALAFQAIVELENRVKKLEEK